MTEFCLGYYFCFSSLVVNRFQEHLLLLLTAKSDHFGDWHWQVDHTSTFGCSHCHQFKQTEKNIKCRFQWVLLGWTWHQFKQTEQNITCRFQWVLLGWTWLWHLPEAIVHCFPVTCLVFLCICHCLVFVTVWSLSVTVWSLSLFGLCLSLFGLCHFLVIVIVWSLSVTVWLCNWSLSLFCLCNCLDFVTCNCWSLLLFCLCNYLVFVTVWSL